MSKDEIRLLIAEATHAVAKSRHDEALDVLDRALELDRNNAKVYELRGAAFAELGRGEAATESFRKAAHLKPSSANFCRLATHLAEIGDVSEARQIVDQILRADPKHETTKKLRATLDELGKLGSDRVESRSKGIDYGLGRKHLFHLLDEHQEDWTRLGWAIIGLALVSAIVVKFNFPLDPPKNPGLKSNFKDAFLGYRPGSSLSAFATIGFFITMILASMIWTSVDLMDRRGRVLWMIPMMLGCFCFVPFFPQSLYMFAGRRD